MLLGALILYYLGPQSLLTATVALSIIAVFEITRYENETGIHDHASIVIDETAGVWLTMVITYHGLEMLPLPMSYAAGIGLLLSFLSFRLFDIWKPSTIGWIDRNLPGGLGVMGDDILAGIAAGMLNLLLFKGAAMLLG